MRYLPAAAVVALAVMLAPPASADVVVTLADGRASVSAKNATVREILTEWARVGQARVVNVERLSGPPVTLEIRDVPELQALDVILRSVSGYLAAPRTAEVPNAARYDRIYVLATSTPVAAPPRPVSTGRAPAPAPVPPIFRTAPAAPPDEEAVNDEAEEPVVVQRNAPPARGPAVNRFQQIRPEPTEPEQPAAPTSYPAPTAPVGVATPGMPVPVPQQSAQPGQPRAPQQR